MRSLASDCRRWRETWRKPGAPQPLPAQVGGNTRRRPETVTRLQLPTNGGKHSANPARAASVHQSPAVDRNACTNACRRRRETQRKPNAQQQLPAQVGAGMQGDGTVCAVRTRSMIPSADTVRSIDANAAHAKKSTAALLWQRQAPVLFCELKLTEQEINPAKYSCACKFTLGKLFYFRCIFLLNE